MKKFAALLIAQLLAFSPAAAAQGDADGRGSDGTAGPVKAEDVTYAELDGEKIEGYLAVPRQAAEGAPAVIMIHEWWGLNENIRSMARRLAGEGYQVLAVDLYEGKVARERADASSLMKDAMAQSRRLEENLRQAHSFLAGRRSASRVGVIGWGFGGGWSLQTALLLPGGIDATVIYYGRLINAPAALGTLEMPILGFFGSSDEDIPLASVRAFEAALESLGKNAAIYVYDGADHHFADPSGSHYREEAAEDSWSKTLAFFEKNLGS